MFLPKIDLKTGERGILFLTLPEWRFAKENLFFKKHFSFLNLTIKYDERGFICGPVLGAPMLGLLFEVFNHWSLKELLTIGWAAKLGETLKIGDLFLPIKAYSLEGTSRLYLGKTKVFKPEQSFFIKIKENLIQTGLIPSLGSIVSVDAPFIFEKNTQLIKKWKTKVCALDMETSAVFSLGKYFNLKTQPILFITDEVGKLINQRPEKLLRPQREKLLNFLKKFLNHEF
ncbi:nucleoside phosphorylase [Thermodesulfobacterium sp. TA1]|uniref:nucleoside phosphorylase n=1 Tax=Thermodesulfobacterium sp. TA1 TaxID=2234087 RepID=UPI0012319275|nr:nucleoside phosphorylase [Thermodesulfobacterium sp. TA1]QER42147.1 nucleoside phosphorylase [Thermodesulfobacterium sp. TA1]